MGSTILKQYWAYRKEGGELSLKAWASLEKAMKKELDSSAKLDGEPMQGKWFSPNEKIK